MRVKFGDVGDSPASRAQKIRSLFIAGRSVQSHTQLCIDRNVWTESELLSRAARACKEEVRDALGTIIDGVPFAGPTMARDPKGAPVWKQSELWSVPDHFYNRDAYASRGGANIAVANKISDLCWSRYGEGPTLLQIVEIGAPSDADD